MHAPVPWARELPRAVKFQSSVHKAMGPTDGSSALSSPHESQPTGEDQCGCQLWCQIFFPGSSGPDSPPAPPFPLFSTLPSLSSKMTFIHHQHFKCWHVIEAVSCPLCSAQGAPLGGLGRPFPFGARNPPIRVSSTWFHGVQSEGNPMG